MSQYYYDINDNVYSTWSDSQLKQWLVKHNIAKSDADIKREKLVKLVQCVYIFFCYSESKPNYMHRENYNSAASTFWSAWSDNQIRDYLIEHGYIRSDAQIERDELEKLADEKYVARLIPSDILSHPPTFRYHDFQARSAPYLVWPDARLRAYLRERGVPEDKIPGARPGLLQEARIRWVQSQSRAEVLWGKLRDIVNGVEEGVEERLGSVWALMRGGLDEGMGWAENGAADGKKWYESGKRAAEQGKHIRMRRRSCTSRRESGSNTQRRSTSVHVAISI